MRIHIDGATNDQLDYAVAVAQGWTKCKHRYPFWLNAENECASWDEYHPTADQAQCGELIDKFGISTQFWKTIKDHHEAEWMAKINRSDNCHFDKSRLVAAVKAYLWSVYPDGIIEIGE